MPLLRIARRVRGHEREVQPVRLEAPPHLVDRTAAGAVRLVGQAHPIIDRGHGSDARHHEGAGLVVELDRARPSPKVKV